MQKYFLLAIAAFMLFLTVNAEAAVVLTGVELDTATPEALAAMVLSGLGVIWGIRKLVKLVNLA